MKRAHRVLCTLAVGFWLLGGVGCATQSLKEQNRRLKESNDRLVAENNRLEEELSGLQRQLAGPKTQEVVPSTGPERAADPGKGDIGKAGDKRDIQNELLLEDGVEVERTSQGTRFRIPDRVFFALGQASLSPRGQQILDKVARILNRDFGNKLIRVDGHTDDTPILKVRHLYPTNWELSSARACTVVRYLVDRGNVNAHRIYPAGFSYYRPVSSTGKGENRRVEITILNENA